MLTLKKTDKPLCVATEGKKTTIVYYDDNRDEEENIISQKIHKEMSTRGKLFPMPTLNTRQTCFISGPSGVGKSHWVKEYALMFHRLFPDRYINLFSEIKDDKEDPLYPLVQSGIIDQEPLDAEIYENPIQLTDLQDSLCIFDDIEAISDLDVLDSLRTLQNKILHLGRHNKIYVLSTTHLTLGGFATKTLLNESQQFILYPKGGNPNMVRTCLKTYVGLDKKQIDRIMSTNSRWIFVNKSYPVYVIEEKKIYLL